MMKLIKFRILVLILSTCLLLSTSAFAAPITLALVRADLNEAIMLIAAIGNLNVSVDDSINSYSKSSVSYNASTNSFAIREESDKKETITMSFNDIEAIDALNIIAKTKDLNIIEENGIFIITKRYLTNAFLNTYVLPIRYGDAEQLRKAVVMSLSLSSNEKLYSSSSSIDRNKDNDIDGDSDREKLILNLFDKTIDHKEYRDRDPNNSRVIINKETNSLIVHCTSPEYERIKRILNELDVPYKQVLIETKLLSINKSYVKSLGIDWNWTLTEKIPNNDSDGVEYGSIRFDRSSSGNAYEWRYGATLNALITNGKAKIISRPNVKTVQGREAIIHIGSQVPINRSILNDNNTVNDVSYRDAGIILRCVPTINEDRSITTTVYTEVSTPEYSTDVKAYIFNTRAAITTVTLKDGEPMVIGGLIGKEEENSISKIPFLGDLPILGALFRNHHKTRSESELMIFLTAHVIE